VFGFRLRRRGKWTDSGLPDQVLLGAPRTFEIVVAVAIVRSDRNHFSKTFKQRRRQSRLANACLA
jgi:hypothetical protein